MKKDKRENKNAFEIQIRYLIPIAILMAGIFIGFAIYLSRTPYKTDVCKKYPELSCVGSD